MKKKTMLTNKEWRALVNALDNLIDSLSVNSESDYVQDFKLADAFLSLCAIRAKMRPNVVLKDRYVLHVKTV